MKSLEELRKLRKKVQKQMEVRDESDKATIIIGMGTCGIAAGAREILQTVLEEVRKRELDVNITQTGCIGMCEQEPLLDVKIPGQERITYGNLKPEDVRRIVVKHVINGNIVSDLVIARFQENKGGDR